MCPIQVVVEVATEVVAAVQVGGPCALRALLSKGCTYTRNMLLHDLTSATQPDLSTAGGQSLSLHHSLTAQCIQPDV
jgi:hypothetical protein